MRLGPYEIGPLLGRGGMGEVYRARDERLGRDVAVKLLRDLSGDEPRRRFADEARAVGALNHPNVLTVYDVGEVDGAPYVVTELLDGETLRQRLQRARPALSDALDWARQLCAGMAAAHAAGIVHRDLKPENLFLTSLGALKVLDFGLAKRALADDSGHTLPGTLVGTVGYMAPEQARGEAVDARADVFAIGAVIYETCCGRRAFAGASPVDTLSAVLRDDPPWPATGGPPRWLEAVVRRCLAKDRSARPGNAAQVGAALEERSAEGALLQPRALAIAVRYRDLSARRGEDALAPGLAEATVAALARVASLDVRPAAALPADADALEAARGLGLDLLVDAGLQVAGPRIRVTAKLVSCGNGRTLGATTVDGLLDDLFSLQDEVAQRIVAAVGREVLPPSTRRAPAGRAYELYLRGKARLFAETLGDLIAAVDLLEQSRDADPDFAPVWAGLADAYARIAYDHQPTGDWFGRARDACERSLQLDPALPEGRYARARLRWTPQGGWDHAGALRDLVGAVRARPTMEEARVRLGTVLWHVGLLDEAEVHLEEAVRLNPRHVLALDHRAMLLFLRGDYAAAADRASTLWREASTAWAAYMAAQARFRHGTLEDAAVAVDRLRVAHPGDAKSRSASALLLALRGETSAAKALAERVAAVDEPFGHFHHVEYDLACLHATLGEPGPAATLLRAAAASGLPCSPLLRTDPLLDPIRDAPEFIAVAAEVAAATTRWGLFYAAIDLVEDEDAETL